MKNSTILVVGTLGLIGAYLYLKRKQSPMINEIVDNSLELSTSSTSSATTTTSPTTDSSATTTTTSPTTDTNATTTTPSVADISLGLNPKPIIETTSPTTDTNATTTTTSPTTDTNATTTTTSHTTDTNATTTTTSPTTDSSATTTTTSPTTDTNATTTTTSPTTDTNATTTTPSVADISLGLNPKPIIETETENYIKAKELSKGFQVLFQQMQDLQNKLRYTYPSYGFGTFKKPSTDNREAIIIQMSSVTKQMSEKNAQAIALGYKILPLGEIEKL
jgi:hypothetical protein